MVSQAAGPHPSAEALGTLSDDPLYEAVLACPAHGQLVGHLVPPKFSETPLQPTVVEEEM